MTFYNIGFSAFQWEAAVKSSVETDKTVKIIEYSLNTGKHSCRPQGSGWNSEVEGYLIEIAIWDLVSSSDGAKDAQCNHVLPRVRS